jgi:hypothetical protein
VSRFACTPEQPHIQLSVSKINDGICDCCNGSDESTIQCLDTCADLLAAQRAAHQLLVETFQTGSAQRATAIQEWQAQVVRVKDEMQIQEAVLHEQQQQVQVNQQRVTDFKVKYWKQRLQTLERVNVDVTDMLSLDALDNTELMALILHACQVAGELSESTSTTCVPLRLAGLDAQLAWTPKEYQLVRAEEKELAQLMYTNFKNNNKSWMVTSSNEARRLSQLNDDDSLEHDHNEDYSDDVYESDVDKDESIHLKRFKEQQHDSSAGKHQPPDDDAGTKREELLAVVKDREFSHARVSFLEKSSKVIETIDKTITDEEMKAKTNVTKAGNETDLERAEETDKEDVSTESDFDADAARSMKGRLEDLRKSVQRGLDYAVSAKVLLDSLEAYDFESPEKKRNYLLKLVVGSLNHGKLSLAHVWQIYQFIIPELTVVSTAQDKTCKSAWAERCPPKVTSRKSFQLPPVAVLTAGETFCEYQYTQVSASICGVEGYEEGLPLDIPNGFLGYFTMEPRAEDDALELAFSPVKLEWEDEAKQELDTLEQDLKTSEKAEKNLQKGLSKLHESIGGDSPEKLGRDGELGALKDKCFSVEAGKYTYELCLFLGAKQKDGDTDGTNLGKWSGASIDEATGQRVWKWENGSKCWNGPARSATAYVSCGVDTKVISAEEPETCSYVMQVESYIACDEDFRTRNEL